MASQQKSTLQSSEKSNFATLRKTKSSRKASAVDRTLALKRPIMETNLEQLIRALEDRKAS